MQNNAESCGWLNIEPVGLRVPTFSHWEPNDVYNPEWAKALRCGPTKGPRTQPDKHRGGLHRALENQTPKVTT